ncbi:MULTISPECIES: hypothetical protein [Streptomyces]|uniref:Uncharacterized protein n=1 Tax=Streptomyces cyaneofuscatus TaxID=66883 RepID=A0ABZ1EZ68_9ACTN|nr:hypothetical protein [Streptomyces cyaneofuscatus]WSB09376.1 hypothetical protein OG849_20145 [Streptomyces cyaneofuscatus]WSD47088.1 hypothetical protein OG857_15255 [Streptomyces cyaneofuscatus]WTA90490.1 hypothetical protein OG323_16400 [Streptomyces cyaneofuscatus]
MSTTTLNPSRTGPAHGATAVTGHHRPHRLGDAVRAVKVFVTAAFSVVVLGEYAEGAGVRRSH